MIGEDVYLWLSGNIWLVSFKISYLCLPLFYEILGQLLCVILPDVCIDNFDIVNFDKSADCFDIYLYEKKVQLKEVILIRISYPWFSWSIDN